MINNIGEENVRAELMEEEEEEEVPLIIAENEGTEELIIIERRPILVFVKVWLVMKKGM